MAVQIRNKITAHLRGLDPGFDESRWESRASFESYEGMIYSLNFREAGFVENTSKQSSFLVVHDSWTISTPEKGTKSGVACVVLCETEYSEGINYRIQELSTLDGVLRDMGFVNKGNAVPKHDHEASIVEICRTCLPPQSTVDMKRIVDTTVQAVRKCITRADVQRIGEPRLQAIIVDLITARVGEDVAAAWPDKPLTSAMKDLDARLSRITSMT